MKNLGTEIIPLSLLYFESFVSNVGLHGKICNYILVSLIMGNLIPLIMQNLPFRVVQATKFLHCGLQMMSSKLQLCKLSAIIAKFHHDL